MWERDFPTAREHDYNWENVCQICGHRVKIQRGGTCIGVPIYTKWEDIPDSMATKTTLAKEHGRKLSPDQIPVGAKMAFNHRGKHAGYYPLYTIADAMPKKQPTAKQLAALDKARYMAEKIAVYCSQCKCPIETRYSYLEVTRKQYEAGNYQDYVCERCTDKDEAIAWAESLTNQDVVILDTETTDLYGEIIEIAIVDVQGKTLLNQRIKPLGDISEGAYRVHGICLEDLKDCPTFPEVYPQIKQAIEGKLVVIYNASYDTTCLAQDFRRHKMSQEEGFTIDWNCAQQWYSQFVGHWSEYHGDYRWQALPGGDHSALGDCLATLEVIKHMASRKES